MQLYVGVNSDGTGIISKFPLKRFFDKDTNREDVISFKDTEQPPHWIVDYSKTDTIFGRYGHSPIDEFLTLPCDSIKKIFNLDITWEDEYKIIEL